MAKNKNITKKEEEDDEIQTASDMTMSLEEEKMPKEATNMSNNRRRLSFEEDSFKKFNSEMVVKYMKEEEMRSKHQAHLLKLREKALIEKTNAELAWLDQTKKKALAKGQDDKMPLILTKEKGIMSKLKQEQENIEKLKEVQRKEAENRLILLAQHSEVIKWCQDKLKKQNVSQKKENEKGVDENSSDINDITLTAVAAAEINSEDDISSHVNSNNNNNNSLIEEKVMKQVKKHLDSEK